MEWHEVNIWVQAKRCEEMVVFREADDKVQTVLPDAVFCIHIYSLDL